MNFVLSAVSFNPQSKVLYPTVKYPTLDLDFDFQFSNSKIWRANLFEVVHILLVILQCNNSFNILFIKVWLALCVVFAEGGQADRFWGITSCLVRAKTCQLLHPQQKRHTEAHIEQGQTFIFY